MQIVLQKAIRSRVKCNNLIPSGTKITTIGEIALVNFAIIWKRQAPIAITNIRIVITTIPIAITGIRMVI